VLEQSGHSVKVLDADIHDWPIDTVLSFVKERSPHLVGVSLNCIQLEGGYSVIKAIRESSPGITVVVGGPHPSGIKEQIFEECPEIDIVVVGEGEQSMLQLVGAIAGGGDLSDVKGIIYRKNKTIVHNEPRTHIHNLDMLPQPNYDLLVGPFSYPGTNPLGAIPQVHLMAARGCPFRCTFCNDSVWGGRVRFRSPQSVADEIQLLAERFKAREVYFQDDTLNITKSYLHGICDEIIKRGLNEKLIFKAPLRANESSIDEALLEKAKAAGFWMFFFGVETGNPDIMISINKKLRHEEIERAFDLTRRADIKRFASFMIGNLGESRSTVRDTYNFFRKIDPDFSGLSIAIPFPGSKFHEQAKERGLIRIEDFKRFRYGRAVTDTGFLTAAEVDRLHDVYSKKMRRYKASPRRMARLLLGSEGMGIREAWWHGRTDYYQYRNGQINYHPKRIPARLLEYEKSFEAGYNIFMAGWRKREGAAYWTKKKAQVILKYDSKFKTLNISCYAGHPNVDRKPVRLTVAINSRIRKSFELSENEWRELSVPIDVPIETDRLIIDISVSRTFSHRIGRSSHVKKTGLLVRRVWLS
jgi:radical SAM superfamily enzyme YgiQ (UPF0313 family)